MPSYRDYGMGQFDWTPEVYLERIRAEIPGYDDLQDQAVAAIPFAPERVLELGMGTGETTRRLIEAHPEAWVVGLDSSPDMVFRARKSYDDVQLARMEDPLPDGPWDLVISVLSVNQLDDEQRRNLCRQVKGQARSLVIGDVFVGDQLADLDQLERRGGRLAAGRPRGRERGTERAGTPPHSPDWRDRWGPSEVVAWPAAQNVRRGTRPLSRPSELAVGTIRDQWLSLRREPPVRAVTSGALITRLARRG